MVISDRLLGLTRGIGLKSFMRDLFEYVFLIFIYTILQMSFLYRNRNSRGILLIKVEGIGDLVLFTTVLPDINKYYDKEKILLVVRNEVKELFEYCPYIDKVVGIDFERYQNDILYRIKVLHKIILWRPRAAFYATYSRGYIGEQLTILSGAKNLFTTNNPQRKKYNILYTTLMSVDEELSEIDKFRKIFLRLNILHEQNRQTELWFSEKDKNDLENLLFSKGLSNKKFVVLFPGARYNIRCWQTSKWVDLISRVAEEFTNLWFIVAGSAKDRMHYMKIQKELDPNLYNKVIDFTGRTSIRELGVLLSRAKLYIGAETGALHMAVAVKTPTLCIMGGGHFDRFFPYGDLKKNRMIHSWMDCYGCNWRCLYRNGIHNGALCIKNVGVDQVYKEVRRLLSNEDL